MAQKGSRYQNCNQCWRPTTEDARLQNQTSAQQLWTFGTEEVRVAWIMGDNILHLVDGKSDARTSIKHLSHGTPFNDWGYEPITANVYIGCFGIMEALNRGADIIISGRTTDAGGIQAFGC